MKKCQYCGLYYKNDQVKKLHHKGYVCGDCVDYYSSKFVNCDVCKCVIDDTFDYLCFDERTLQDMCETCFFNNNHYHYHDYKHKVKFLHHKYNSRKHHLHIGAELELETTSRKNKNDFLKDFQDHILKDYFTIKYDGSLNRYGVEIVSQPMTKEVFADYWVELFKLINQYNFHESNNCGLHFHLDRMYLDENTIRNIDYLINTEYRYLSSIAGREYNNNEYCEIINKYPHQWGKDIYGKYCAVNLSKNDTVEIRICASTNDYHTFENRIKAMFNIVDFCKNNSLKNVMAINISF